MNGFLLPRPPMTGRERGIEREVNRFLTEAIRPDQITSTGTSTSFTIFDQKGNIKRNHLTRSRFIWKQNGQSSI